ncbi:helix-turn-helix transcriptional regulator [Phytoactinopolyspora mesophila]|uniref:WYL domain-containing protein n=1 Tax=Phytoactinopolyspora mesophila TaxID=2650750 RepID=A0A7K3M9J5_9ACTN|nr:YafY family protein [Phytoactinopolyspora mesophila]NDL59995.1 WYL domain-containing protein [Phytoactinopolyspora mesophila]
MRADRLVQIVLLLQTRGRMTAAELAQRLDVSARTIQRDLDALSLAGIPVYADRGRAGGWSLSADYRTRLNGLSPAESAALFIGTTGHVLSDLGLSTASTSAITKLLSAVPASARRDADLARERILVDHADWQGAGEASTWLPVLQQGVWEERKLRLHYGRARRAVTIAPLGLVAKRRSWYLVGLRDDGEFRTYRVQRISQALLTDQTFDRPAGFDLAGHWENTNREYFASLRDCPVRLRVRGEVGHRLRWAPNAVIDDATERPDGWWDVVMTFERIYEARVYLLGLAGDVVVLEPAELRADMLDAARALLEAHDADHLPGRPSVAGFFQ